MIILPDEELTQLERSCGADVRLMGPWNSDGVFGFSTVSMSVVEKAAAATCDPVLAGVIHDLKLSPERTKAFVEIVKTLGPAFVQRVVTTYREAPSTAPAFPG